MINLDNLTLTKLCKNDLKTLVDWARNEGWNPGAYDYHAFWNTDPEGYYGFFYQDKLIAGGAIVSYSGTFGFMGLFIVHADFRGLGIGTKLWYLRRDLLLKRINNNAAIGMDGVVAMQPFYEKGGFNIAFRDERYECIGKKYPPNKAISLITSTDHEMINAYDIQCFGYKRKRFLENWLVLPESKAFKFYEDNKIKGYAVIRKVDSGYKIGPLFANNNEIAEALYKACLNTAIDAPVYLDIPVINNGAVALVKKYNAKYVFECARMHYRECTEMDPHKIYGITTFELG